LRVRVILDSNFLFVPFQFGVDIFEELLNVLNRRYVPVILSPTYHELLTLARKGGPKLSRQAQLAIQLAEKCQILEVERRPGETPDDVIVRVAGERRWPVATNDRALRRRLRELGVPVIFLRQGRRLELEGAV